MVCVWGLRGLLLGLCYACWPVKSLLGYAFLTACSSLVYHWKRNYCMLHASEPPNWGGQKGVTPICSDLFRFFRFVPICAPCFREFVPICSDLFRFVPICSVLFRFAFRTNQNKSGKPLSADPFCNPRMQKDNFLKKHRDYITVIGSHIAPREKL